MSSNLTEGTSTLTDIQAFQQLAASALGLDLPVKVAVAEMTTHDCGEGFVSIIGPMDPQMLAQALAMSPGGSGALLDLSPDVLLARCLRR